MSHQRRLQQQRRQGIDRLRHHPGHRDPACRCGEWHAHVSHHRSRATTAAAEFIAEQVLHADDELAHADDLVAQGDGVTWRQLDALFDLAMFGAHAHRHLVHPNEYARNDCAWCERAGQFWHVALVDVIAARRRTSATELDAQARRAAELPVAPPEV